VSSVRIGIIGLGRWAFDVHIPNLLQTPNCEVTVLCSRNEANRARAREQLGTSPREYTRFNEALEDPDLDAVIVCPPNHLHEPISVEALNAGKHVLCEKPIAMSLSGCARLREARETSGKVFQTGLELRYSDVAQIVHRLVQEDQAVGPPAMMWCNILRDWGQFSGWRGDLELSGGIYHELACHYLDLFNWFAGGLPLMIQANGASLTGQDVVDHLWTTLRYPGEVIANLGICIFAPAKDDIVIEIIGPQGRITADIISGRVNVWKRGATGPEDLSPKRPDDYRFYGFPGSLESLHAFVEAIQANRQPAVDLQVGCEAVATALAADEALSTGQSVNPADLMT
jgi:predicted dehydrogenase